MSLKLRLAAAVAAGACLAAGVGAAFLVAAGRRRRAADAAAAARNAAETARGTAVRDAAENAPAPVVRVCLACGKRASRLLRCAQCQSVHFCDRDCQIAAFRAGHKGAACVKPDARAAFDGLVADANERFATSRPTELRVAAGLYREAAAAAPSVDRFSAMKRMEAHSHLRLLDHAAAAAAARDSLDVALRDPQRDDASKNFASAVVEALSCLGCIALSAAQDAPDALALEALAKAAKAAGIEGVEEREKEGPVAAAVAFFEHALTLCSKKTAATRAEATVRGNLSRAYERLNRIDAALDEQNAAVKIRRALLATRDPMESHRALAGALCNLGGLFRRAGEEANAQTCLEEGLAISRKAGDVVTERAILTNLVNSAEDAGTVSSHAAALADVLKSAGRRVDDACGVCLEALLRQGPNGTTVSDRDTTALGCGHIFHKQCVSSWLRDHGTCPTCKRPADRDTLTF
ncbi:hypothetical protein M885DRAFT_584657 [Pelagophyceae sp. CCMP2097]|nr:hypothetical protein M885DRAFT_584657 [Pelagophyceae sp. CCMP2097]